MKPELQQKLHESYPKIFPDKTYIVGCGEGWFEIINRLCDLIQNHLDYINNQEAQVVITYIKEKYGGLSVFYRGGDQYTNGAITMAELLSYTICEICGDQGTPGSPEDNGWVTTRCSKHNR
jgi:hypothetical protein